MKFSEFLQRERAAKSAPGPWQRPFLIAEAGVNHGCSLAKAKEMIELAASAGADAIKFQSYKAATLASRHALAYWDRSKEPSANQRDLFARHDAFGAGEFAALKTHCDHLGIQFLSTPFDSESARYLNDLQEVFKISSSDLTNRPLVEQIAGYGKPILLSTGAATLEEIGETLAWIQPSGCSCHLLHCVLSYPCADENAHLGAITALRQAFPDRLVGYSDHTLPGDMFNLVLASLLGARILEKHFTSDKTLPGNDHYHAMDGGDLRHLNAWFERVQTLYGPGGKQVVMAEQAGRLQARRSLVLTRSLPAGHALQRQDLVPKRPGSGVPPQDLSQVLGRRLSHQLEEDHILQWTDLEEPNTTP
jgi:N-acetylneuraminate synthase